MRMKRKTLEELNIMDDYLMTVVASNEEVGTEQQGLPSCNIYDIEPHLQRDKALPKHNRFSRRGWTAAI